MNPLDEILIIISSVIIVLIIVIFGMIAFPPPESIPKLETLAAPFRSVDFSQLPKVNYFITRDGSSLAYREYATQNVMHIVVLVHGSSGSSNGMHPLAMYLQAHNMTVYSLDIRGHGDSGKKGDIEYIGQLENDFEDFVKQVLKQQKATLVGFSSGGGLVLRFAASERQNLFTNYILLSPYIGYNSPTVKPRNGGWAEVSYPRIIGISLLGPVGQKMFGHLPVITFAIDPEASQYQVAQYSFNLLMNQNPHLNFRADIAAVRQPLTILVGENDEVFNVFAFEPLFAQSRAGTKVIVVPKAGHITLTTTLPGISAVEEAIAHQ